MKTLILFWLVAGQAPLTIKIEGFFDRNDCITAGILRVDDGLAEAVDGIRLCGNGVVPQQSVPAWQKIKEMAHDTTTF